MVRDIRRSLPPLHFVAPSIVRLCGNSFEDGIVAPRQKLIECASLRCGREKKIGCGNVEGEKVGALDIGEMAFFSKAEKTRNNFLATSLEYIVR